MERSGRGSDEARTSGDRARVAPLSLLADLEADGSATCAGEGDGTCADRPVFGGAPDGAAFGMADAAPPPRGDGAPELSGGALVSRPVRERASGSPIASPEETDRALVAPAFAIASRGDRDASAWVGPRSADEVPVVEAALGTRLASEDPVSGAGAGMRDSAAVAASESDGGTFFHDGHYYRAGTPGLSWSAARAEAKAAGGRLVVIDDAAENAFVTETFWNGRPIWLGIADGLTEGAFRAVDHGYAPIAYANWLPGQPDDTGGGHLRARGQDRAVIASADGRWDDSFGGAAGVWTHGRAGPAGSVDAVIEFDAPPAATGREVAGDTATDATIAPGAAVRGAIDFASDADWFRCVVEAGDTYVFRLESRRSSATPLADAYLELRDDAGALLAADDDSGGELDAMIRYVAERDGVVYLAAQGLGGGRGDYVLSVDEGPGGPVTLSGVPAYAWRHGCGPTAAASLVGHHDQRGYPDLFAPPAWRDMRLTASVADRISSAAHDAKYGPTPDDPRLPVPPRTSLADFMGTSADPLGYGWTYTYGGAFGGLQEGLRAYAASFSYDFVTTSQWYHGRLWDEFVAEIDAGRPVVFTIDTDADGATDHMAPGIGYEDRGSEGRWYAAYTTWSESETPVWREFVPMGAAWGVGLMTTMAPGRGDGASPAGPGSAAGGGAGIGKSLDEIRDALASDGEFDAADAKIYAQIADAGFSGPPAPLDDLFALA